LCCLPFDCDLSPLRSKTAVTVLLLTYLQTSISQYVALSVIILINIIHTYSVQSVFLYLAALNRMRSGFGRVH
jgi:hypothetical protein